MPFWESNAVRTILALLSMLTCAAGAEVSTFYVSKTVVEIPFHGVDSGPAGIVRAKLFVTADQGRTWKEVGETGRLKSAADGKTVSGRFTWHAPGDGRYGFDVVAVDAAGNQESGPKAVGLFVVVDSKPPNLKIVTPMRYTRIAAGDKVPIAWNYQDMSPPLDFMVYSRRGEKGEWKEIGRTGADERRFTWYPMVEEPGIYELKVAGRDAAGNSSETTVFVRLLAAGARVKSAEPPGVVANTPAVLDRRLVPSPTEVVPVTPPAASLPASAPMQRRVASRPRSVAARAESAEYHIRLAGPPLSTRRVFDIEYEVASQGPSGISFVDLYYTTDGGATWKRYGRDGDGKSPITFYSPGDGVYGFYLRGVSGSGVAGPAPAPGTKPAATTRVDTRFPSLTLERPRGGERLASGQVLPIVWSSSDENFGPKPIFIDASFDGGKSWQRIAGPLERSGRLNWKMPETAGSLLRLRLEATDQAGNRTIVETASDIVVDNVSPVVRIRSLKGAVVPLKAVAVTGSPPAGSETAAPLDARSVLKAAESFMHQKRLVEAAKAFETALKVLDGELRGRIQYSFVLMMLGRPEKAVEVLKQARKLAPDNAQVSFHLAAAYAEKEDWFGAQREALKAVHEAPKRGRYWLLLAKVYHMRANDDKAAKCCERVLQLSSVEKERKLAEKFLKYVKKKRAR